MYPIQLKLVVTVTLASMEGHVQIMTSLGTYVIASLGFLGIFVRWVSIAVNIRVTGTPFCLSLKLVVM